MDLMKFRSSVLSLLLPVLFIQAGEKNGSADQKVSSARPLFDGKTLQNWEISPFGTGGPVRVSDGTIFLGMGQGCTGIRWTEDFPTMNYCVSLEAKRIDGNDFFCGMTFPVDDEFCSLIVSGWGGNVVGLSSIDGLDASENETALYKRFEQNRWYTIRLCVTPDSIVAWIDDKPVVEFATADRELTTRPEVELSKPFGIASWVTTAALRNIFLEEE